MQFHLTLDGGIDVELRGLLREVEQGRVSVARAKQLIEEAQFRDALSARLERAEKAGGELRFAVGLSFTATGKGIRIRLAEAMSAWDAALLAGKPAPDDPGTANPGHPPLDVALDCQRPGSHGER